MNPVCPRYIRWPQLAAIAFATLFAVADRANAGCTGETTVFAAASLKESLDEITARFTQETGKCVTVSYAGTAVLARQIEQAAPADIFFSANRDWMDHLDAQGLIDRPSRLSLLGNALVLIAPHDSTATVRIAPGMSLALLLGSGGRLAMADADAVPAGIYAKAALVDLGLWESVADRVVESDNVRSALAFVARGEAPLGIVYATDAIAEPRVRVLDRFPADSHPPIRYPVALTAESDNADAALLLRFLQSETARGIFAGYGFALPESRSQAWRM